MSVTSTKQIFDALVLP